MRTLTMNITHADQMDGLVVIHPIIGWQFLAIKNHHTLGRIVLEDTPSWESHFICESFHGFEQRGRKRCIVVAVKRPLFIPRFYRNWNAVSVFLWELLWKSKSKWCKCYFITYDALSILNNHRACGHFLGRWGHCSCVFFLNNFFLGTPRGQEFYPEVFFQV